MKNVVLPNNAAYNVEWRKGQTTSYWVNFKQDGNSLPKLSKGRWLSLDIHAETICVIW